MISAKSKFNYVIICIKGKEVKIMFTLEHAMKAQRGSRGITLLFP